ncbi:MAG: ornithine carbamoyltransferase [Candidatus Omnitrophica bacterium]|nr:ornithine carbamoyltransferase [Candidatus Omnitrophota bacterium]MDD5237947.1 ornithine carbamoyltransferase [Candidatus Omnitrophota bacterium]
MKKDFISIKDLTLKEIEDIFSLTDKLKKNKEKFSRVLSGKTLALIFQKPSNRTRVSFEVGMHQLGGNSLYLAPHEINLGVRESIADVAKTLSRYVDAIVLRTFEHKNILEMAKFSSVPVINGLSDFSHPCQALADIYTIKEKLKNIKNKTLAYVGDGNNVCNSLLLSCPKVGMNINVATPKGFEPQKNILLDAKDMAKLQKVTINLFHNAFEAVKGADVIYTDVWASMGQEKEAKARKKIFKEFQVNKRLIQLAKKGVLIMHCLPAHRGEEITDEVINSKNSVVFDQAENRMHVQKAILIKLLK